jgi:hypothetical protein
VNANRFVREGEARKCWTPERRHSSNVQSHLRNVEFVDRICSVMRACLRSGLSLDPAGTADGGEGARANWGVF